MSTTLLHMVWLYCKFRMQPAGLKCAAHSSIEIQDAKIAKNSPSGRHHTTLSGYIFATKARIDNQKTFVKHQHLPDTSPQYGELRPTNGWDLMASLGHPRKFQRVSHLGFVTAATSLNGGQPKFARCLAVSWTGTLYIHFLGLIARCKIRFASKSCVLIYWQRYFTALEQWASAKVCGVVQGMALRNFRRGRHQYSAGRPSRWASEKLFKQQYLLHMPWQYGELRPTNRRDRWRVFGTPENFNGVRVLPALLQRRRLAEVHQTLHDVWPSAGLVCYIHIHFPGLLPPNGIVPNFTLCPSLAFSCFGSVNLLHGTGAVGVSQTLRRWAGRPSRWAVAHIIVHNNLT